VSGVRKAACIGGGVIGAGWAARLAWHGIDVTVCDPHPEAERRCRIVLANGEWAMARLYGAPVGEPGAVAFTTDIAEAVADADFVQESAPEDIPLKQAILAEIDRHAPAVALVCSSTSGLRPTVLQSVMDRPGRFMVGHPFNPVYLLPLVEVCGGEKTDAAAIDRAITFYRSLGMQPLHVRTEIDGFIADRLMEALWREALWLVNDGVATVAEIDDAVRYGPGLRWAMMGTFLTYRIAGGEDGMRHFMRQFGPALQWPWTKLTDVPDLTDDLIDRIATQSDEQADGVELRDLERQRDDGLVAIMQALKPLGIGAGAVLADQERARVGARAPVTPDLSVAAPLCLHTARVLPEWTDYNGHMTEHRYLQVFGDAADALFAAVGVDAAYLAGGHSYYTVESHLRHLGEAPADVPLHVETQLLDHDAKRIHAFHRLVRSDTDTLLATAEQLYLHVDTKEGRVCDAPEAVRDRLAAIAAAHGDLPLPDGAGRSVGLRRQVAAE
jgi:carnitine 3-dehydrogenase